MGSVLLFCCSLVCLFFNPRPVRARLEIAARSERDRAIIDFAQGYDLWKPRGKLYMILPWSSRVPVRAGITFASMFRIRLAQVEFEHMTLPE
ncbi:exported hypothetical protein [Syntrophobacter sp. SbD1]|nr:exported hypothetical protein [Syntrophobacter sp. SbD1]